MTTAVAGPCVVRPTPLVPGGLTSMPAPRLTSPVPSPAVSVGSLVSSGAPAAVAPKAAAVTTAATPSPSERYGCPHPGCSRAFSRSYNLKAHRRIHSGDRPFVCAVHACGKTFRWRSSLTSHTAWHARQGDRPTPVPTGSAAKGKPTAAAAAAAAASAATTAAATAAAATAVAASAAAAVAAGSSSMNAAAAPPVAARAGEQTKAVVATPVACAPQRPTTSTTAGVTAVKKAVVVPVAPTPAPVVRPTLPHLVAQPPVVPAAAQSRAPSVVAAPAPALPAVRAAPLATTKHLSTVQAPVMSSPRPAPQLSSPTGSSVSGVTTTVGSQKRPRTSMDSSAPSSSRCSTLVEDDSEPQKKKAAPSSSSGMVVVPLPPPAVQAVAEPEDYVTVPGSPMTLEDDSDSYASLELLGSVDTVHPDVGSVANLSVRDIDTSGLDNICAMMSESASNPMFTCISPSIPQLELDSSLPLLDLDALQSLFPEH